MRYLKRGELLDADRAARMQAAGGDADLGAEAELAAVGELGRGVVQHDGGIDFAQEFLRRCGVVGDDRVGVVRAVALDMRDGGVDAVDHLTAMMASRYSVDQSSSVAGFTRVSAARVAVVAAHLAAGVEQHLRPAA